MTEEKSHTPKSCERSDRKSGGKSKRGKIFQPLKRASRKESYKRKMKRRDEKRREKQNLKSFFKDLQSPTNQETRGKEKDFPVSGKRNRVAAEAEEILKLGRTLGLELVGSTEEAKKNFERMLDSSCGSEKGARRVNEKSDL